MAKLNTNRIYFFITVNDTKQQMNTNRRN